MRQIVYFRVVDCKTLWSWNGYHSSEAEAREEVAQARGEGECPNPVCIERVTLTVNDRNKTVRKDYKTMGFA